MFSLVNGNFQLAGGGPVANGSIRLLLSNTSAIIIATGAAAPTSYIFNLDVNGNFVSGSQAFGNAELSPPGTFYTAQTFNAPNATGTLVSNFTWVVGPAAPYVGTLFPNVTVFPPVSIAGQVTGTLSVTGNSGLPAATNANLYLAGTFGSPVLGKIYVGDGTGWELDFAKRVGSADTTLFKMKDSGVLDASVGFSVAGTALAAANLSNGVTGSGAVVLATLPTFGGTGVNLSGSTSGTTTLKAAAVASGTLTLPAATDTLVGKATTDTLTNKTLGGSTPYNRLRCNGGSAMVAGNIVPSAGWGTTASVGSVKGTDNFFEFKITSSGTGQSANPTITITFVTAFANAPFVTHMPGSSGGQTGTLFGLGIVSISTTTLVLKMDTITPIAGQTYSWTIMCQDS